MQTSASPRLDPPVPPAGTAIPRRAFLQASALGAAVSLAGRTFGQPSQAAANFPSIVVAGAEDHARRLRYHAECERRIRKCLRRRTVVNYLPGQVIYNLGEYPARQPWADPDDWDDQQLLEYRRAGVELIQIHSEWCDFIRLFGADVFTPINDRGFRRFVELCHRHGLKVIPYMSTGYFDSGDPHFRPEWAKTIVTELFYSMARCLPDSPGWRAYLLPKLKHLLDEYGVDGFYNDVGYVRETKNVGSEDEGSGVKVAAKADAAFEDLLGLVYDEVRRRGGIVKIHAGLWYRGAQKPPIDPQLYDYLWVGETAEAPDRLREAVKDHPPYVVPCFDLARTSVAREDDLYLHTIPYLQFPLLMGGRPFTGERMSIPGIRYKPETAKPGVWTRTRHVRKIWEFHQKNPRGPFSYAWWDSCPGRPEAQPTFYRWLKLYRAMVEAGTTAYLEVADSNLFSSPLPAKLTASVFANRHLYLALANYATQDATVETADVYRSCTDEKAAPGKTWRLPPRSLLVLRRA